MAILTTGNTFASGDQVTAATLNSAVNDAEFASGAVDNTSTQLSGTNPKQIIVKDAGISTGKIATGAVTTDKINASAVTTDKINAGAVTTAKIASDVVINTSGSITGAAGSFTTLTASDDANFDSGTLFVDASADTVGIGTTSPSYKLDVNGTGRFTSTVQFDGQTQNYNGAYDIYRSGAGYLRHRVADQTLSLGVTNTAGTVHYPIVMAAASDVLIFNNEEGEMARFDTSGNLGINTASPAQLLDVNGGARVVGNLFVGTDDTTPHGMIEVYGGGTGQNAGGEIRLRTSAEFDPTYDHYFIDAHEDDLRIGRAGGADITLTSDGYVGIGSTAPDKLLVVAGVGSEIVIDDTDSTDTPRLRFRESGSTSGSVSTDAGELIFDSGTTERMRIDSSGNVGIGDPSPSAPLTVTSTTGGVLLPRMTTTQMNAISSPTNGEMIYNTTANKFYGYAGGAWVALH